MKKLKVLFASIVFLLIVLACSQVNAGTLHTVLEVATFLNNGGGQVEVQGGTIILHHDVTLTEDIYVYDESKTAMTIDLNGHYIDLTRDQFDLYNIPINYETNEIVDRKYCNKNEDTLLNQNSILQMENQGLKEQVENLKNQNNQLRERLYILSRRLYTLEVRNYFFNNLIIE